MVKPPTYDWRCPRCDSVNAAYTGACATCQHDVTHRRPTLWREMRNVGTPLWRCVAAFALGCIGLPLLFGGALLFVWVFFPLNTQGMLWSAVAALLGAVMTWFANKLADAKPT